MTSILNQYFSDAQLAVLFKCGEETVKIYHQRFRTIERVLAPYIKIDTIEAFVRNHSLILEKIENAPYAELTRRNWVDAILRVLYGIGNKEHWGGLADFLTATEKYEVTRYAFEGRYWETKRTDTVSEQEIREKLKIFPNHSFESVIIRLWLEVPVRDDFQLHMINEEDLAGRDLDKNYLIPYPAEKHLKVLIQKSKNVSWEKKQKPRLYTLSKELTRDFLLYLKDRRYPQVIWKTKLYKQVGRILTKIGVKHGRASINLLRRAVTNTAAAADTAAETAYKALHNCCTAKLYEDVK